MPDSGEIEVLTPTLSLPERRRASLKLELGARGVLSAGISMPKKCKFESMSFTLDSGLAASPVGPGARTILPHELASRLSSKARSVLLLDCRPFLAYNTNHIQGAVNVSCADRLSRKRLQQGKVSLVDLVTTKEGKDTFKRRCAARDIVLYDEGTADPAQVGAETAIVLVLTLLLREGKEAFVLKGGLHEFRTNHEDLCDTALRVRDFKPLYSPTTPIAEPEIETAIASQILPFLYLGNERDAGNLQRLRDLDVTYVLNVTSHIPPYFENKGIHYQRIPASDSGQQNLRKYFEEAIKFIDEARQNGARILVHCQAGVSRSATVTIAYLLKHTKMTMADAYKYVKAKRSIISPNFNFMGQLLEFEQALNQGITPRILNPRLGGLDSFV